MAGGKMSARQKMINLMYLVFIAMLAMNMSKEVLSAFGFTNQKLEQNNRSTKKNLNSIYDNLDLKAIEKKEKYQPLKLIADKVRKTSDEFYVYLDTLKAQMIRGSEVDSINDFQAMDNGDWLDNHFFVGEGYKQEGTDFLNKINGYRDTLIAFAGGKYISSELLQNRFNTDSVNKGGKKYQKFLIARYFQFPMVASLTNFTQIQTDIRNSENDIITNLLRGQLEIDGRILNNYKGIVNLDKTAYFVGEKVTGQVVLGRYDKNLVPDKVILNQKDVTNLVQDGQVILNMPAGSIGEKTIKGTIFFTEKGEEVLVPFESKYSVANKPNAAIVSADKMKVVYKGISNPISVALPGVSDKDIRIKPSGHKSFDKNRKSPGKYNLIPSNTATEVVLDISATLSDGTIITDRQKIRTKEIPAAQLLVNGTEAPRSMSKGNFNRSVFTVGMVDFDFDLNITTTQFQVVIGGRSYIVQGTRLNNRVITAIEKVRSGTEVNINQIQANVTGSDYKLKKIFGTSVRIR